MIDKTPVWLTPPTFEDDEHNRIARILHTILFTLLAASILIIIASIVFNHPVTAQLLTAATVVILIAIWLTRRGHLMFAGVLVLFTFWIVTTYLAIQGDGVHDTALVAYPALIVAASLIINKRLFAWFTFLLVVSVGVIAYCEITGSTGINSDRQYILLDAVITVIILLITAISLRILTNSLTDRLNLAHKNEQILAETNRRLQQQTEALRASEQRYSSLFEYATDAIFIESTAGGTILEVNEKACELLGYTKDELLSLKVKDIVPPRSSEQIEILHSSLNSMDPVVIEAKNKHKNGTWIDVEVSIRKIDLQDREVTQVFVRDITERKQAEEALKESETRLRTVINHIPFDLWMCNSEGRYIIQNNISFDLAGNLIGKTVDDLDIPPEIKTAYKQKHLRALGGYVEREEIEAIVKGEPRILDSVHYPIRNGEDILGFIGMQIDVTERRQAETALKEYSERLEEMVTERTEALEAAQERLVRQEKLAMLGQLAGSIGHELRNPLGVITNAIYFLQMVLTDADTTVKEYLDLIAERVAEADKIVADLLNLSRNRTADRKKVAVLELVDETLARLPILEEVNITKEIPPGMPNLFVDPQQIRQVLTNLITNAYQAMPNGGGLTISAQAQTETVRLSVTDTGVGMSAELAEKIFEPLFTTKAKGIGLGLAVSRNLIDVNSGTVAVESVEGQGTTFIITLPGK